MKETLEVLDALGAAAPIVVTLGRRFREASADGLTVAEVTAILTSLAPSIAMDKELQRKLAVGYEGATKIPGEFKNAGMIEYVQVAKKAMDVTEQVIIEVGK